eukprot:NODE_29_length_33183_cov_0.333666.p28 type:complete len:104 gc:universal NODE_29_length_33183_cov_0.333666:5673-5984(+)
MYGHECRRVLNALHLRIAHMNSDIANIRKRGRYTSKKKLQKINNRTKKKTRLYQRIEDPTTTMHYEVKDSLCKYLVILLPEFATQGMSQKLPNNHKRDAVLRH